ncbi:MAG: 50S ribosomal protein L3 [Nitrospinota bacterium]|jgi:large subunit ribosomal protein L3|nr:50S ribosomal protein L3 [Nitrospinota bacterium]MDP6619163.1 50S ribosomal protein L3 [Nitrospinota bacterium]HJM42451.1 50S ribosomal protein L3 [Nitrospinota bacterium]
MAACILGRKLGMTQVFDETGNKIPVTVIEAGPCPVVQLKTTERDGYAAVQLGFQPQREKRTTRPRKGHFDAAGVAPTRILREFPLPEKDESEDLQAGHVVNVGIFGRGDVVNVVATSKGKGFQGGMKRHGWKGGRASHGSMFHRSPGSIGNSAQPSRVFPGHRLPGQMGNKRVTIRHLSVVRVMAERNLILLKGAVPGPKHGVLEIKRVARGPVIAVAEAEGE